MKTKPSILLYSTTGIGVIVNFPSGVLYSNQVGGFACLHPEAEGVYVPFQSEVVDQEKMLLDYFTGPKWRGGCSGPIDIADADFVDQVLQESIFSSIIRVDRSKLHDSCEAWVHVVLSKQPQSPPSIYDGPKDEGKTRTGEIIYGKDYDIPVLTYSLFGFGDTSGILTWNNSD